MMTIPQTAPSLSLLAPPETRPSDLREPREPGDREAQVDPFALALGLATPLVEAPSIRSFAMPLARIPTGPGMPGLPPVAEGMAFIGSRWAEAPPVPGGATITAVEFSWDDTPAEAAGQDFAALPLPVPSADAAPGHAPETGSSPALDAGPPAPERSPDSKAVDAIGGDLGPAASTDTTSEEGSPEHGSDQERPAPDTIATTMTPGPVIHEDTSTMYQTSGEGDVPEDLPASQPTPDTGILPARLRLAVEDAVGAWEMDLHRHAGVMDLVLRGDTALEQVVLASRDDLERAVASAGDRTGTVRWEGVPTLEGASLSGGLSSDGERGSFERWRSLVEAPTPSGPSRVANQPGPSVPATPPRSGRLLDRSL